ncbi:hypothetical protein CRE_06071 [Caenorhabditis remanei]|uniref:Uncharacterized protein n=1 Tax=Caenorhabditis remanei TaxID=31234 RepID=E3NB02_CAERE|nr:hypothetical protein CRE_06071 [Caenorhabditis remanei]
MPSDTFDPIPLAYQNIRSVPFYMNFEYKLNWVTFITIIDLLLNIIGILIFIQIPIFYFKNKQKIKNIGLRLDVFQSFLLMQIWNISMLIGEFLMFKIPFTGVFTNYCANNNPQVLLRFTVFFFHWAHYSAQLFTLLFCSLRVAILYSNSNREKEKMKPVKRRLLMNGIEKSCLINCTNGKNCKDHLMWEQLKTVRLQNRNNGVSTNEADPRENLSKFASMKNPPSTSTVASSSSSTVAHKN